VISNVDDDLLFSLAVTCDQQCSAVGPVIHSVLRPSNVCRIKRRFPSVRPTRQLEIRADLKYFLPLSVRYSVIADSRRSYRSPRPPTYF